MMKKIKITIAAMMLFACTFLIMGFDATQQKVYDDAGILSAVEEAKLQQLCVQTAQQSSIDIIIVTTADTQDKTSMEYAEDFFMAHEFGYETLHGDGVLLLVDMDNRMAWISTSGKGIRYLSDTRIDSMVTAITTYLKKGDYNGACGQFISQVGTYMKTLPSNSDQGGAGNTVYVNDRTTTQKLVDHLGVCLLISLIVGTSAVVIMMLNAKAKMTVGCQTYVNNQKFDVRDKRDLFINTTVVKYKIQTSNNSSGGGGGSSHSGSGGHSFGGGGGKF